jgi:enediyne polyketide synthase
VELVADAEVGRATDPYLDAHALGGERLLPAVFALEAMAQAARALVPERPLAGVERLELLRPLVAPAEGSITVRVAALAREDGGECVDVVLRCSTTGFAADHVRATLRLAADAAPETRASDAGPVSERTPLVDAAPVYDAALFQRGPFRRVRGYDALRATACRARLQGASGAGTWFGEFAPQALLLGDPAARDAALHAVQACLPHATLLPVGADVVELLAPNDGAAEVRALEIARDGDLLTYDIEVVRADGAPVERWRGARFRALAGSRGPAAWPPALLGPWVERRIGEIVGAHVAAAVGMGETREGARAAALALLGRADVVHRADGRPLAADDGAPLAVAHATRNGAGDPALALVVSASGPVGCDLEPVAGRDAAAWAGLLGPDGAALAARLAAALVTPDGVQAASTCVWAAREALRKAGAALAPLTLERVHDDGWVLLRAGTLGVAVACARVAGADTPLAIAVATAAPVPLPTDAPGAARAGAASLAHAG